MTATASLRITPEQYLEIDRAAEIRSEYYDGQMFAMSGGLLPHALISAHLIASLSTELDGKGCDVATSDLRIRISPQGPFFYPDVSVYCGDPELADNHKDTLVNPVVIIEVLSKSSESYDRGLKSAAYRSLPSLRNYVLVSQTEPRIEVFSRQINASWASNEFAGMDAVCYLSGIDCHISLTRIYKRIKFENKS